MMSHSHTQIEQLKKFDDFVTKARTQGLGVTYPQGPITLEANPNQSLEDNIKLTQDLVETYHYDVDLYYDDLKLPITPGSEEQQIIKQYHTLKEHREAFYQDYDQFQDFITEARSRDFTVKQRDGHVHLTPDPQMKFEHVAQVSTELAQKYSQEFILNYKTKHIPIVPETTSKQVTEFLHQLNKDTFEHEY